jgi:hypothetical protein
VEWRLYEEHNMGCVSLPWYDSFTCSSTNGVLKGKLVKGTGAQMTPIGVDTRSKSSIEIFRKVEIALTWP